MPLNQLMAEFERDQERRAEQRARKRRQIASLALPEEPWDATDADDDAGQAPELREPTRTPEPKDAGTFAAHQRSIAGGCACDDCEDYRAEAPTADTAREARQRTGRKA